MKLLFQPASALSLCTLLWACKITAQTVSLTFSDPVEQHSSPNTNVVFLLTEDNNFKYESIYKGFKYSQPILRKTSKVNNEIVLEKEFPFDKKDKQGNNMLSLDLVKLDNGYIVFFKRENKEGGSLVAQRLDETLNIVGVQKTVAHAQNIDESFLKYYNYIVERHGDYLLIYGENIIPTSEYHYKNKPFVFTVSDINLNLLWEKGIDLSRDKYFKLEKTYLDGQQNLIAVFNQSTNDEKVTSKTQTNKFVIVKYNHGLQQVLYDNIQWPENANCYDLHWSSIDSIQQNINFAGVYIKEGRRIKSDGIFNVSINYSTPILNASVALIPFTPEIVGQFIGVGIAQNDRLLGPMHINHVTVLEDRNIFVVQEVDSSTRYPGPALFSNNDLSKTGLPNPSGIPSTGLPNSGSSVSSSRGHTTFQYNNILTIQTTKTGAVQWFHTLYKSASGQYPKYLKSYSFFYEGIVYTLFNTDLKPLLKSKIQNDYISHTSGLKSPQAIFLCGLDSTGKQVVTEFYAPPQDNKGFVCTPMKTTQYGGKLILYFEKPSLGEPLLNMRALLSIN